MQIQKMYEKLMSYISSDSQDRREEKSNFIESRIKYLQSQSQRLTADELSSQLQNYINYSTHGVVASLFHQKNLDSNLKNKMFEELSFVVPADTKLQFGSNVISAHTFTDGFPNFAIIYTEDSGISQAKVTSYSDNQELEQILKTTALSESISLFNSGKINNEELITSFSELSTNKNELVSNIFQYMKYDISDIAEPLKSIVNLEVELDKRLRQPFSDQKIESAIIQQMISDGSISEYTKNRISAERSPLSDDAQRKLIILVDKQYAERENVPIKPIITPQINNNEQDPVIENEITSANQNSQENANPIDNDSVEQPTVTAEPENTISSADKEFTPKIDELSKAHEILFRKVHVGEQYYFESTDKAVKIHPEKIAIAQVSRDSVALAIDAAINSYGNNLSITGTPKFKDIALSILSLEQYKDIQLNNPELQEQLNQMRGIAPVENIIAPGTQQDTEQIEKDTSLVKPIEPTVDTPNVDTAIVNHQASDVVQTVEIATDATKHETDNTPKLQENDIPIQETNADTLTVTQPVEPQPARDIDLFAAIDYREVTPQSINEFTKLIGECNNLEQVNEHGETPLLYATLIGMSEEVKALIDAGANVNHVDNSESSALIYAAGSIEDNSLEITNLLLKAGADVNLKNQDGGTALLYATVSDLHDDKTKLSICSSLLNAGAQVNACEPSQGNSALTYAVRSANIKLVQLLLDSGADVSLKDHQQRGILHQVPNEGPSLKIAELLIQHGADMKALDENQREAPILNAIRIAEHFQEQNDENNTQSQSRSR